MLELGMRFPEDRAACRRARTARPTAATAAVEERPSLRDRWDLIVYVVGAVVVSAILLTTFGVAALKALPEPARPTFAPAPAPAVAPPPAG